MAKSGNDSWLYDFFYKNDGREKFLLCQRKRIKYLWTLGWSLKDIKAAFNGNISKAQIHYILNPESEKRKNINNRKLQSVKKYLTDDQLKEAKKKSYRKKRERDANNGKLF